MPATRRPFGRARGGASGGVFFGVDVAGWALFSRAGFKDQSSWYAAVAPPVPAGQALRPLNRQAVDVGTPEKPAPADRPHRRQAAIVREDADGVRRKSEHARGVARGEEVVGIGCSWVCPRSRKRFVGTARTRRNHFYEPRQRRPRKWWPAPIFGSAPRQQGDRGFAGESPPQGARTLVDLRRLGASSSTLAPATASGAVAEVLNKFRRIRDTNAFLPPPKAGSVPPGLLP